MKNILNISILVILVAGLFSAEIDLSAVDIGDRSRKAVTDMNESLDKLAQQYFEATEKIKSDAVKNLEKERSRTKDGLVALGIQHQIKLIGEMKPPIDLLGNTIKKAPDLSLLIGKWDAKTPKGMEEYEFHQDNKVSVDGKMSATWSVENDVVTLTFGSGNTISFSTPKGPSVVANYSRGGEYFLTKK